MDNDEKTASRGDETLPINRDEPSLEGRPGLPLNESGAKDQPHPSARTVPFPGANTPPAPSQDDDRFGMPDFGFFAEPAANEAEPAPEPLIVAGARQTVELQPADATTVMPLKDGTGWETVGSIMKHQSLRARIEMQDVDDSIIGELFANEDNASDEPAQAETEAEAGKPAATPPRHEANVTPFPGAAVHRHSERTPSDLLRGGGKSAEIFEELTSRGDDEQAGPPLEARTNPDALADAVQSALRNIYGSYSEPQEARVGGSTVADALAGANVAPEDPAWGEERALAEAWQQGSRARDFDPEASASDGGDSEGVLDYFYTQRRQERQESQAERLAPQLSSEMSLNDYAARSALEEKWEPEADPDEQPRRIMPFPARDRAETYRGRMPELQANEPPIMRGGSFYQEDAVRPALDATWGQPPYPTPQNARGSITPTYAPAIAAPADQFATQGPDSGHLLGAAGLGLIGGIALAGVLAVFVFNSFVDENGQTIPDNPAKVVERLAPATAASNPLEQRPSADSRAAETPASTQSARIAPEPAAPALPDQQRSAALPQAPQPQPEPSGRSKLTAASASGTPDAPIRLNVAVGDADVGDALISLKGLPKGAKLSTGIDVGGGQWLLPPGRLRDLTVSAPATAAGSHALEVQLLKDDAQTSISDPVPFTLNIAAIGGIRVASNQQQQPAPGAAAAPGKPDAQRLAVLPDEAPLPETDFLTQMLIRDGNKRMREGDIAAARRLYEQASVSGNPEAALAMGRSYDPTYFEKLNVKTGKPDPATAFEWYKKALDGGLVTAKVKIDTLKQWLQR